MIAVRKIKHFFEITPITKLYSWIFLLILGAVVGYYIGIAVQKERYASFLKSFRNIREKTEKYNFISPLVGGSSAPATDVGIYSDLRDTLTNYFKEEEKRGELYAYSFYFRDLSTGFWFGINEGDTFSPASLLKLPIAIAAYKQAENDPSFLKKQAIYTKELDAINDAVVANSESSLVIGRAYSVEDLVKIMLTQSDNGAKNLLITTLNRGYLDTLFALVSLDDPQTSTTYHISSIEYALFLRMLYGASYLNEDDSDLLLSYLTESTFGDGLVAGLPKNISIAHKYGVYQFEDTSNGKALLVQQLNDCGVIYHAQRPYLVCMMTKGKDLESLYRIYKYVSSTIYNDQEQEDE